MPYDLPPRAPIPRKSVPGSLPVLRVASIDPTYRPEDGDFFEAVRSALEHFEIPAAITLK